MKKSEFEKLKIGDVVRVRTLEELRSLRGVWGGALLRVYDDKTINIGFSEEMHKFCGKEMVVSKISPYDYIVWLDGYEYKFTRKMLAEEVR